MALSVICVGKLKERFFQDAAAEYQKRLKRLTPVEIIEIPDQPEPTDLSPALLERIMAREGEGILRRIPPQAYVIALCVEGKERGSEAFAARLSQLFIQGRSDIVFVIGGSLGLHPSVTARADERMSMGPMTFPHQLARVMLLEQLYRAAKLNAGERYHK